MAKITVDSGQYNAGELYQWDINQTLEIHGLGLDFAPRIHFTNDNMDETMARDGVIDTGGVITVGVPNVLLRTPYPITVYVCKREGEDGENLATLYKFTLFVNARPKPDDYIYYPKEATSVEVAVENALAEAKASGMFDGEGGRSAYELAVADGYEGTEEEWLESLHGYTPKKGVDYWTPEEKAEIKKYIDGQFGDVETVLDNIIAMQNSLIGGDSA